MHGGDVPEGPRDRTGAVQEGRGSHRQLAPVRTFCAAYMADPPRPGQHLADPSQGEERPLQHPRTPEAPGALQRASALQPGVPHTG